MMNRREFFSTWIFQNRSASVEVEVMEVFSSSEGPSALLVHHGSEAARNTFAEWLHSKHGTNVVCQSRNGLKIDGRIFRVRMCFGRGLILMRVPVALHPKDVLTIS